MSKSSGKKNEVHDREIVIDEVIDETIDITEVDVEVEVEVEELPPHVEVSPIPTIVKKTVSRTSGIVINCNALRLREGANIKTKPLAVIPVNTKVSINLDNSTESFYEVSYPGDGITLVGFCVKEFILLG